MINKFTITTNKKIIINKTTDAQTLTEVHLKTTPSNYGLWKIEGMIGICGMETTLAAELGDADAFHVISKAFIKIISKS